MLSDSLKSALLETTSHLLPLNKGRLKWLIEFVLWQYISTCLASISANILSSSTDLPCQHLSLSNFQEFTEQGIWYHEALVEQESRVEHDAPTWHHYGPILQLS